ncbi:MAG TPA: hypothetical protein VF796_14845, partial [Humisphaera sp.]
MIGRLLQFVGRMYNHLPWRAEARQFEEDGDFAPAPSAGRWWPISAWGVVQRATAVLAVVLMLAGGAGGAYWLQHRRADRRLESLREAGMAAAAAGDHRQATRSLGSYLELRAGDEGATEAFARAALADPGNPTGGVRAALPAVERLIMKPELGVRLAREAMAAADAQQDEAAALRAALLVLRVAPADPRALRTRYEV